MGPLLARPGPVRTRRTGSGGTLSPTLPRPQHTDTKEFR